MYSLQERETALTAAVDLFSDDPNTPTAETVLAYAAAFLAFIGGGRLRLTVDALGTVPPARTGSRPEAASQSLLVMSLSGRLLCRGQPIVKREQPYIEDSMRRQAVKRHGPGAMWTATTGRR